MLGPRKPSHVQANSALSFGPAGVEGAMEGPREINHTHSSVLMTLYTLAYSLTKAPEKRTSQRDRKRWGGNAIIRDIRNKY